MEGKQIELIKVMMEFTGERMTTEYKSYGSIEHLHRYSVISNLLKTDMTVVDVACGEGYGTNLISGKVTRAIGVDIAAEAVAHATGKYKSQKLEFIQAPATDIPLENNIADLIVSFETLEHLNEHDIMIKELKRVLKKDGMLVISTPDKDFYSKGSPNPYHIKELTFHEFRDLLAKYFAHVRFFFQKTVHGSYIYNNENPSITEYYEGDFEKIRHLEYVDKPDFIIAIASDSSPLLPDLGSSIFDASSVFDREYEDYLSTRQKYLRIITNRWYRYINRFLKLLKPGS